MSRYLLICISFYSILIAQPDIIWSSTHGGTGVDKGYEIQQTNDGGFIIAASNDYFGYPQVWLIKYDIEDLEEWNRFPGAGYYGKSVHQTSDGGYIVLGGLTDLNYPRMYKTDDTGYEEWNQNFGPEGQDARSIRQAMDGGFIVAGMNDNQVWLIKTDEFGDEEWSNTFGGTSIDGGNSIQQTEGGGYIITGYTASIGNGGYDVWLIKTDEFGDEEWNNTFGGEAEDSGLSVQQTEDGGYIIAGYTASIGNGGYDVWLIKTDEFGDEEWNNTFGGEAEDRGNSVIENEEGEYLIVGFTHSYGSGSSDVWLLKVAWVYGCTDPIAINYDPEATADDGSCIYLEDIEPHFSSVWQGVPLNLMGIYVESATIDDIPLRIGDEIGIFDGDICVGVVQLEGEISETIQLFIYEDDPNTMEQDGYIAGNDILFRFWDVSAELEVDNISVELLNGSDVYTPFGFADVNLSIELFYGCTDPLAINYNPEANIDDGSCIYEILGCTDPEACNFDPNANTDDGSCLFYDCAGECGGTAYFDECGVCDDDPSNDNQCFGCIDPLALNYDPEATVDDGSCEYPGMGDVNGDSEINVLDIVVLVQMTLYPEDFNFVFWADINSDGFINVLDIVTLVQWVLFPETVGCTDPCAENYNPEAIYDDGSCIQPIVTDIDGNLYDVACVGSQLWLVENLKTTHYSNGDPIPTGFSNSDWYTLLEQNQTGAYAIYNNDPMNFDIFGNLYNWYAINDERGICPEGFHVPTDEEWIEMELELGMSSEEVYIDGYWRGTNQGSQLASYAELWEDCYSGYGLETDIDFSNSGFSALPAGYRDSYGVFGYLYSSGYIWTSSEYSGSNAWHRQLYTCQTGILRGHYFKKIGLSVRCIED